MSMRAEQRSPVYRFLCSFTLITFLLTTILPASYAQAVMNLPSPGTMVAMSAGFAPPIIRGITLHQDNPLRFDFIVDTGDNNLQGQEFEAEATKLIKYFLASLTVPEDEFWVNLSPYEKDRIIPEGLGVTELGRDLLAQDYLLKQITASLMYPEERLGSEFWKRVYAKAQQLYGTTEIPVNTFNKVWIVPDKAVVYEHNGSAFVGERHLKVMLEEDYLSLKSNLQSKDIGTDQMSQDKVEAVSSVTSAIVREILIPELEKEVNEGAHFANLRQIFNSMILATWYKKNLRESLLGQVYIDQNKVKGIDVEDRTIKQQIYDQYLEAFKKGVYNYIKEDYDPATQEVIPRKYFSGGVVSGVVTPKHLEVRQLDPKSRDAAEKLGPESEEGVLLSVAAEILENLKNLENDNNKLLNLPKPNSPASADTAMLAVTKKAAEKISIFYLEAQSSKAVPIEDILVETGFARKITLDQPNPEIIDQAWQKFTARVERILRINRETVPPNLSDQLKEVFELHITGNEPGVGEKLSSTSVSFRFRVEPFEKVDQPKEFSVLERHLTFRTSLLANEVEKPWDIFYQNVIVQMVKEGRIKEITPDLLRRLKRHFRMLKTLIAITRYQNGFQSYDYQIRFVPLAVEQRSSTDLALEFIRQKLAAPRVIGRSLRIASDRDPLNPNVWNNAPFTYEEVSGIVREIAQGGVTFKGKNVKLRVIESEEEHSNSLPTRSIDIAFQLLDVRHWNTREQLKELAQALTKEVERRQNELSFDDTLMANIEAAAKRNLTFSLESKTTNRALKGQGVDRFVLTISPVNPDEKNIMAAWAEFTGKVEAELKRNGKSVPADLETRLRENYGVHISNGMANPFSVGKWFTRPTVIFNVEFYKKVEQPKEYAVSESELTFIQRGFGGEDQAWLTFAHRVAAHMTARGMEVPTNLLIQLKRHYRMFVDITKVNIIPWTGIGKFETYQVQFVPIEPEQSSTSSAPDTAMVAAVKKAAILEFILSQLNNSEDVKEDGYTTIAWMDDISRHVSRYEGVSITIEDVLSMLNEFANDGVVINNRRINLKVLDMTSHDLNGRQRYIALGYLFSDLRNWGTNRGIHNLKTGLRQAVMRNLSKVKSRLVNISALQFIINEINKSTGADKSIVLRIRNLRNDFPHLMSNEEIIQEVLRMIDYYKTSIFVNVSKTLGEPYSRLVKINNSQLNLLRDIELSFEVAEVRKEDDIDFIIQEAKAEYSERFQMKLRDVLEIDTAMLAAVKRAAILEFIQTQLSKRDAVNDGYLHVAWEDEILSYRNSRGVTITYAEVLEFLKETANENMFIGEHRTRLRVYTDTIGFRSPRRVLGLIYRFFDFRHWNTQNGIKNLADELRPEVDRKLKATNELLVRISALNFVIEKLGESVGNNEASVTIVEDGERENVDSSGLIDGAIYEEVLRMLNKLVSYAIRIPASLGEQGDTAIINVIRGSDNDSIKISLSAMDPRTSFPERLKAALISQLERDRDSLLPKDRAMVAQEEVVASPVGEKSSQQQKFTKGGIDFNSEMLDLQIKRDNNNIPLPVFQQPIGDMNIEGFFPVIIDVTPVTVPVLLGQNTNQPEGQLTRLQ